MKNMILAVSLFAMMALGTTAKAEGWSNRPNVIRAAERFATEIEHLDEAMHDINAPAHIIQKVHHVEETALEFLDLAKTATYQMALAEFNHIRSDMKMLRSEFQSHPQLLSNPQVAGEWRATWTAYRQVDMEMFHFDTHRWSSEKVEQLKKDLEEIDRMHQ